MKKSLRNYFSYSYLLLETFNNAWKFYLNYLLKRKFINQKEKVRKNQADHLPSFATGHQIKTLVCVCHLDPENTFYVKCNTLSFSTLVSLDFRLRVVLDNENERSIYDKLRKETVFLHKSDR